jgi:hypothetical protein
LVVLVVEAAAIQTETVELRLMEVALAAQLEALEQ